MAQDDGAAVGDTAQNENSMNSDNDSDDSDGGTNSMRADLPARERVMRRHSSTGSIPSPRHVSSNSDQEETHVSPPAQKKKSSTVRRKMTQRSRSVHFSPEIKKHFFINVARQDVSILSSDGGDDSTASPTMTVNPTATAAAAASSHGASVSQVASPSIGFSKHQSRLRHQRRSLTHRSGHHQGDTFEDGYDGDSGSDDNGVGYGYDGHSGNSFNAVTSPPSSSSSSAAAAGIVLRQGANRSNLLMTTPPTGGSKASRPKQIHMTPNQRLYQMQVRRECLDKNNGDNDDENDDRIGDSSSSSYSSGSIKSLSPSIQFVNHDIDTVNDDDSSGFTIVDSSYDDAIASIETSPNLSSPFPRDGKMEQDSQTVSESDQSPPVNGKGKAKKKKKKKKAPSSVSISRSDSTESIVKELVQSAKTPKTPLNQMFGVENPRLFMSDDGAKIRRRGGSRSQDMSASPPVDIGFQRSCHTPTYNISRSVPRSGMFFGNHPAFYDGHIELSTPYTGLRSTYSVDNSLDMLEADGRYAQQVILVDEDQFNSPHELKKATSFSTKEAREAAQWLKGKLEFVKVQTDKDVMDFLKELDQISGDSQTNEVLLNRIDRIRTMANVILQSSIDDLRAGSYRKILVELQEDLQHCRTSKDIVVRESGKFVRKLMFIFSRCSRLLQFMTDKDLSLESGIKDARATFSRLRSATMVTSPSKKKDSAMEGNRRMPSMRLQTPKTPARAALATPTSSPKEQDSAEALRISDATPVTAGGSKQITVPKLDTEAIQKQQDQEIQQKFQQEQHHSRPHTPPLLKSPSKSFFARVVDKVSGLFSPTRSPTSTQQFDEYADRVSQTTTGEKKDSSDTTPPRDKRIAGVKRRTRRRSRHRSPRNIDLLCRICEELVHVDALEKHSETCATKYNIDMRAITSDERLNRIAKSIRKRLAEHNKKGCSPSRRLTDLEVKKLEQLAFIASSIPSLKYTIEDIEECESYLESVRMLLPADEEVSETDSMISGDSGSELTSSDVDSCEMRRGVLRRNRTGMTVPIFGKRLEEVICQKLTTMRERLELSLSTGQDPNAALTQKVTISDFEILKPISRGAYGRVFLGRKKKTGDIYAIKVLKKEDMARKNLTKRVLAERNILAVASSNSFVVRFYYSFSGREYLYLVMEYAPGGDLFSLLQENGNFDEDTTRHYMAEIVLALEYLHGKKIVHRDIKPDNILIAADGHLRLTDFGLSEMGLIERDMFLVDDYVDFSVGSPIGASVMSPTHMSDTPVQYPQSAVVAAGTPDYLAPEILLGQEHSYPADWWALGVVMFEFLTGCPPFNDDSPHAIFDNILSLDIPWPPEGLLSEEAVDLMNRLLEPDPTKRLGYNGADEVKRHPFFKDVNWDNVLQQEPPFVPRLSDDDDTTYFEPRSHIFPVDDAKIVDDPGMSVSPEKFGPPASIGSDGFSSPNAFGASLEFSFLQHNTNLAEKNRELIERTKTLTDENADDDDNDETFCDDDDDGYDDTLESPTSPIPTVVR